MKRSLREAPEPYRIEWRYQHSHQWMLMHEAESHEEALELAADCVKSHKGFARVLVQHVIHRTRG